MSVIVACRIVLTSIEDSHTFSVVRARQHARLAEILVAVAMRRVSSRLGSMLNDYESNLQACWRDGSWQCPVQLYDGVTHTMSHSSAAASLLHSNTLAAHITHSQTLFKAAPAKSGPRALFTRVVDGLEVACGRGCLPYIAATVHQRLKT